MKLASFNNIATSSVQQNTMEIRFRSQRQKFLKQKNESLSLATPLFVVR